MGVCGVRIFLICENQKENESFESIKVVNKSIDIKIILEIHLKPKER